jgi:hypothetical protein
MQFQEIARLETYEAVRDHMFNRVFRKLQTERSTSKLVRKILAHTNVLVNEKILDEAVFYIDIRHLIVHNASRIDIAFSEKYQGRMQYMSDGNRININVGLAKKGNNAIWALCEEIDRALVVNGYIDSDMQ